MNISKNQNYTKTEYLNILRWLSTVAVILIHLVSGATDVYPDMFDNNKMIVYCTIHNLMNWSVPIFIMISGVLFLNPKKELTLKKLFNKYIKRIVLALFSFGTVYALMEIIFKQRTFHIGDIFLAIYNVVSGNTWAVLWYLYMLIGLYLITPFIRGFLKNTNKEVLRYILIILFIFTSIIPSINEIWKININFYIPVTSIFLLYYILGYYIQYLVDMDVKNVIIIIAILINILIIMLTSVCLKSEKYNYNLLFEYKSPLIVLLSVSMFMLFKKYNYKFSVDSKYNYLCFGIYLIHCFYINILYKFFKFLPVKYPTILALPILLIVIFILSLITSYILNKICIFKKYIL